MKYTAVNPLSASKMTYIVSGGALNSTLMHSLTTEHMGGPECFNILFVFLSITSLSD